MTKENPAYNKKYNLRLPEELYVKIEELGRKYDRSSNEQIVYMLRTWQEPATFEDRLSRLEDLLTDKKGTGLGTGTDG